MRVEVFKRGEAMIGRRGCGAYFFDLRSERSNFVSKLDYVSRALCYARRKLGQPSEVLFDFEAGVIARSCRFVVPGACALQFSAQVRLLQVELFRRVFEARAQV